MSPDLPIEPLEVLFEADSARAAELPERLQALYGGGLELKDPCVYANFVSTIDGVVAVPSVPRSNELVAQGSAGDRLVMGLLRASADCVLIGAGTLAASPRGTWLAESVFPAAADAFAELRHGRGQAPKPEIAILTGRGTIDPGHPVLAAGAVVLTSDDGARNVAGRLPADAEVIALGAGPHIDAGRAVEVLRERGHRRVLSEAGPHTFGSLVTVGAADELFLTISPLLLGDRGESTRFGLVEAADLLPDGVRGELVSVRRHEQHLFLRYELTHT
jgi:riboflavin biosynthesis pyrimidine reductase